MANHDALTGLPNRALLKDRLAQALLYAQRYDRWVTVAFIDLDNFKFVNDSLGHNAGDELLKMVARRMVDCVRATDTVVRLGGDEFVVLLVDQPEERRHRSPRPCKISVGDRRADSDRRPRSAVTCSIGIANYPNDGADADTLLANADAAMYRAKEIGRDNFQFYTPELNTKVHEKFMLQEELRGAVARSEFVLVYQPQVDLRTGRVFAVEALIRWKHPTLGMVPPDKFIPIAEETGLIVPIGDWVLHEACRQNKAWQDAGLPPVTVCVNVSARQFKEKNLIGRVVNALQRQRPGGPISRARADRKPDHAGRRAGGRDDARSCNASASSSRSTISAPAIRASRAEDVPGRPAEDRQVVHRIAARSRTTITRQGAARLRRAYSGKRSTGAECDHPRPRCRHKDPCSPVLSNVLDQEMMERAKRG